MKLNYITFMVRDIEKSLVFYQELAGLEIVRRISPEGGQIVFLANAKGETMLELVQFSQAEKVEAKGMFISFHASDALEQTREKAISLGFSPSEIFNQPPKPKYFNLKDPDGVLVEFSA